MDFFLFGIVDQSNIKKYLPPEVDFDAESYLTIYTYDKYIKDVVPTHEAAIYKGEYTLNDIIERHPTTQRMALYSHHESELTKYFLSKRSLFMNFTVKCDLINSLPPRRLSYEMQYLQSIANVLRGGDVITGRNGDVLSIFDAKLKIDLSDGFPILTVREINFRSIVEEALWILRGQFSSKILEEKKINIWKKDTTRAALDARGLNDYVEGELGPAYGFQLRHAGADYSKMRAALLSNEILEAIVPESSEDTTDKIGQTTEEEKEEEPRGYDQWKALIAELRAQPQSRRALLNLWSASEVSKMALPPCAFCYQFQVRGGKLNCILTQRSWDIILGWNPATAALLTHILAHYLKLEVGTLTINVADCHIYSSFVDLIKNDMCIRAPYQPPKLKIVGELSEDPNALSLENFELVDYRSHGKIFFPQQ